MVQLTWITNEDGPLYVDTHQTFEPDRKSDSPLDRNKILLNRWEADEIAIASEGVFFRAFGCLHFYPWQRVENIGFDVRESLTEY